MYNYQTAGCVKSPAIGVDGSIYLEPVTLMEFLCIKSVWHFKMGLFAWKYAAPAIGNDGTIYIGTFDGRLCALGDPIPQQPIPEPSTLLFLTFWLIGFICFKKNIHS